MKNYFNSVPKFKSDFEEYYCSQDEYLRVFRNCDEGDFESYIEKLKINGFDLFDKNLIDSNIYCTFTGKDILIHAYFVLSENTVRIVVGANKNLYHNEKEQCKKICDTVVYQFETDHTLIDCGMCYIIQCCDGSYFIIDSAHFWQLYDNVRIYNFLKEHSPDGKIVINGWFFSHEHDDHVVKFIDFIRYNMKDVTIENVYYNFVDVNMPDSKYWGATNKNVMREFNTLMEEHSELRHVRLHSGQKFYCRNLEFTVLCTHEDVYPKSFENFNESSTVIMMTAQGNKVFFPGDAGPIESDIMTSRFSAQTLKSDIVQVAHHGHIGTSCEFYRMVNAPTIMFPTTQIKHDEEMSHFEANRVAHELSQECFISSNGTVGFKLPYKVGNAEVFPDETFENFDRIEELWGYQYTDEFKDNLRRKFYENGGKDIKEWLK